VTIDESVDFAVGVTQRPTPAPAGRPQPRPELTSRQLEVARLITDGLSNKQIAARLFLSERTVETHITNIFNKLGEATRVSCTPRYVSAVSGWPARW